MQRTFSKGDVEKNILKKGNSAKEPLQRAFSKGNCAKEMLQRIGQRRFGKGHTILQRLLCKGNILKEMVQRRCCNGRLSKKRLQHNLHEQNVANIFSQRTCCKRNVTKDIEGKLLF